MIAFDKKKKHVTVREYGTKEEYDIEYGSVVPWDDAALQAKAQSYLSKKISTKEPKLASARLTQAKWRKAYNEALAAHPTATKADGGGGGASSSSAVLPPTASALQQQHSPAPSSKRTIPTDFDTASSTGSSIEAQTAKRPKADHVTLSEGDLIVYAKDARGNPEKEDYVLGLVGPTNSHRDLLGGTEIYWAEADWIDGVAQVQDLRFSGSGKFEDLKKIPTTRKFKAKVGRAEGGHVTLGAGAVGPWPEESKTLLQVAKELVAYAAAAKQELQQRRARVTKLP